MVIVIARYLPFFFPAETSAPNTTKVLKSCQLCRVNFGIILFRSPSPCGEKKERIGILIGIEIKMYGLIWRKSTFLHYWVFSLSGWGLCSLRAPLYLSMLDIFLRPACVLSGLFFLFF